MNQTRFFEAVSASLERNGIRTAFLCFHERSHEHLLSHGKHSFNAFEMGADIEPTVDLAAYEWPSLNLAMSHYKAAFEVYDSASLTSKLRRYVAACEAVLNKLEDGDSGSIVYVQELGGFLSNMASYYVARRRGVDNIFVEPSFFRGRVFFVRNSFAALRVPGPCNTSVTSQVNTYLDEAVKRQQVVIPVKDVRHYRRPVKKLTDLYNVRRLVEKLVDKYLLGKREEFGYPGGHMARHVRMLRTSRAFAKHYRPMPASGKGFVYYPLHVPADVALTIRAPEYVDQYTLIDYLARVVPNNYEVAIKEHPALVGASDRVRMLTLLSRRDNVRLLDPRINNYEVIRAADAVVTVNSKSGAEALLLGRPVVVLGDAFYRDCALACSVDSLRDLPGKLSQALESPTRPEELEIRRYFQDVWDSSYPGELYDMSAENVESFADSLIQFLGEARGLIRDRRTARVI